MKITKVEYGRGGTAAAAQHVELGDVGAGTAFFISWDRLTESLKVAGSVKQRERIVGLSIDENGMHVYVRTEGELGA